MFASPDVRLVLASASTIRKKMLRDAGLDVHVRPANVDEDQIRETLSPGQATSEDVAEILARAKAEAVSGDEPGAIVIGADQIMSLDGEIFSKPADLIEARLTLRRLRGKRHALHSAVAVARQGEAVWSFVDTAYLDVRQFSDPWLDSYITAAGDRLCSSVGAYQLESYGVQLFDRIDGDYFTILGLPLLQLLRNLRENGWVSS